LAQKHESLKVTFEFGSPVVVDSEYPIYLDALLAFAKAKDAEGKGAPNPWSEAQDLPLGKAGKGSNWVWKASVLLFTPGAPRELVNMQRKSDPDMFYRDHAAGLWGQNKSRVPTINTKSGQLRAYQFYVSTQWMLKAEAWYVGDEKLIEYLLSKISHIGKMGRNGWGQISNHEVSRSREAAELWKLRVLPADVKGLKGVSYVPTISPPRAPYWDKLARVEMFEPIMGSRT